MAEATKTPIVHGGGEDDLLRRFGYKPQFQRVLGLFGDFSLGYSYMSPLAGFSALFAYALTTGGPRYFWTMPIVLFGQLMVSLVFAEASSQYPIAGGVYQWARRVGGPYWGFLTAWLYLLALLGTNAGLAAGLSPFVASFLGVEAGPVFNALVAVVVIIAAMLTNLGGTRILGRATELGVWTGLAGLALLGVYLLLFGRVQPLSVLNESFGAGADAPTFAWLSASLIGIWIFFGFEACGDLAEEVEDASTKVPRAMVLTMLVGGLGTLVIAAGMTLAIPNIADAVSGKDTNPVASVLQHAFGNIGTKIVLLILIAVVYSAAVSIMASTSRLLFSLGRDRLIFGASALSTIDEGRGLPVMAVIVSTIVPTLILLVGIYSSDALTNTISFATAGIYLSFQMVVAACLYARFNGWQPAGPFKLGASGMIVTILALIFGLGMVINIAWPRPAADSSFLLTYLIPISLVVIMITGLLQLSNVTAMLRRNATSMQGAKV